MESKTKALHIASTNNTKWNNAKYKTKLEYYVLLTQIILNENLGDDTTY